MRLFYIVGLLCFSMFSCRKDIDEMNNSIRVLDDKVIKNQDLNEILKNFIANSPFKDPEGHILIYFSIEEKDTVFDLIEQPVFDCENFVGTFTYLNKDIFLYTISDTKNILNGYIDLSKTESINCVEKISTSLFYVSYKESFVVRSNLLIQR